MDFQQTIFRLTSYWAERGCIIQEPYDVEVGAGTVCPEAFLRVLGPKPYRVAYVQRSRRGNDGYGENPNRLRKHQQLQVILQRSCVIQEPYDAEVGAGTVCPEVRPKPYRVAYVQPSRRGNDGYGENPNRLSRQQQLQMILRRGCVIQKPYRVTYVQPSRRGNDGYGENPNRLSKQQQFQMILKPSAALVAKPCNQS